MSAITTAPTMVRQIEIWPTTKLHAYARNARTHSPEQVAQIAASILEFGFVNPVLVDASGGIVAGHGRILAAHQLGWAEVPVIILDHLTEIQRRAYIIADNKLALNAGWNLELLAQEVRALEQDDFDIDLIGFSEAEMSELLATGEDAAPETEVQEAIPEAPANPVTRPGDVWVIGPHRLVCGDCRIANALRLLFPAQARANVVITSPPYATQRGYDPSSGFKPVPPEEYVEWFRAVAAGVESVLVPDGSYFLNIQAHADDGERNLYVVDLLLAHKRQWGWRFVDELIWYKTDQGVPGGWNNRFKNAWEPIYHFCRQQQIKFNAYAVAHASDDCFDYSPSNPKSTSGSGLLGTGPRGAALDPGCPKHNRANLAKVHDPDGRFAGLARPCNVIEARTESTQGSHSAPFPRPLPEFFIKAFSDAGDIVYDPFMGSGTTMAAAEVLGRAGYGCEISPAYCDVILRRMINLTAAMPMLDGGETFTAVAEARGVPVDQVLNPKQQDSHAIKHHGPNPHYGRRRKPAEAVA